MLFSHEMRTDSSVEFTKGPKDLCRHWRNPQIAASAPDEDLGPGTDWREIARGPSHLTWILAFLEAT